MPTQKVLYADSSFTDLNALETALAALDVALVVGGCRTPADVIARGELIDTSALVKALTSGHISAAALDVVENPAALGPEHPLCSFNNVILTPHSAWLSEDALKQCKNDLTAELVRFFTHQPLKALLNPEVLDKPST